MKASVAGVALLVTVAACAGPSIAQPAGDRSAEPSAASGHAPPACLDARFVHAEDIGLVLANCVDQADPESTEQLWTWDGQAWERIAPDGPTAHVVTGIAWDEGRDVLVRYGGIPLPDQQCAPETWEWGPSTGWERLEADPPPACDHAKLAYDPGRSITLLFGGGDEDQDLVSGTWGWDGEAWHHLHADEPQPEPRAHFGFLHDAAHAQTLLFGGYDGSRVFEDLWSWDGFRWQRLDLAGPTGRSHHGMAVGPDGLLVFGGATGPSTFTSLTNETWLLADGRWQLVAVQAPSPRGLPALGYDPAREVTVLYGGFGPDGEALSDLWEWDGAWSCVAGC